MTVSNIFVYFQERFPIAGVAFISISFALFAMILHQGHSEKPWLLQIVLLSIAFAAFLLRQRVTDEFKDKHHDKKHFPSRPFQRKLISAKGLVVLGIFAFLIELTAVFFIGGVLSLAWYLPVLAYSLLMAKEFFVGTWLNRHFTTYFLLHEIIFIWFAIWLFKIMAAPFGPDTFAWAAAFACAMMSLEVARKFELRRNSKGKVVKDTYSAVWGRDNTLQALQLLVMTTGIALAYAESSIIFAVISATASLVLSLFTMRDTFVKVVVALHLSLLLLAGVLL